MKNREWKTRYPNSPEILWNRWNDSENTQCLYSYCLQTKSKRAQKNCANHPLFNQLLSTFGYGIQITKQLFQIPMSTTHFELFYRQFISYQIISIFPLNLFSNNFRANHETIHHYEIKAPQNTVSSIQATKLLKFR